MPARLGWRRCAVDLNTGAALRIRLHLRLHPGKGFATAFSLWLRWGRLAALRRSGRIRRSLPLWYRTDPTSTCRSPEQPADREIELGVKRRLNSYQTITDGLPAEGEGPEPVTDHDDGDLMHRQAERGELSCGRPANLR